MKELVLKSFGSQTFEASDLEGKDEKDGPGQVVFGSFATSFGTGESISARRH